MPRPKCCRQVGRLPDKIYFKPQGVPSVQLEEVVLSIDELEAVRLADFEGLYQEQAARRMNISRQTFGRIIIAAHEKIADALINGKALKIDGGEIALHKFKTAVCCRCRRVFTVDRNTAGRKTCPGCRMPA